MTSATSVPILVFLGLSVLELGAMYAIDRQTSDRRQTKASLNASALWGLRHNTKLPCSCFSERVVNVWNSLPDSVDFSTLSKFRRSVMRVDFSKFLRCF